MKLNEGDLIVFTNSPVDSKFMVVGILKKRKGEDVFLSKVIWSYADWESVVFDPEVPWFARDVRKLDKFDDRMRLMLEV